jgi:hypothetical protein
MKNIELSLSPLFLLQAKAFLVTGLQPASRHVLHIGRIIANSFFSVLNSSVSATSRSPQGLYYTEQNLFGGLA